MSTTTTPATPVKSENVFEKIGHGVETVGKDIGHVIVEAVEFPAKATKVVSTITTDYPQLKTELLQLVTMGNTVLADGVLASAAKGLNWAEDVATVKDVLQLAEFFKNTFVPAVVAAYNTINSDVA